MYSIFSNDFINEIAISQTKLIQGEGEYDYDQYLEEVLTKIYKVFEEKFTTNYLFGKAYYMVSEGAPLMAIGFCPNTKKSSVFFEGIIECEKLVREKKASSLAEYVVKHNTLGVMLYQSDSPLQNQNKIPQVTYYKYGDTQNPFTVLDNEHQTNTSAMVEKHREMAIASNESELFSYVLRTRNLDKDFNGTIYLVFKSELQIKEYRELIDVFTFVMQARIKYDFKNAQWKRIMEQITHSKYNIRAVVNENADELLLQMERDGLSNLATLYLHNETLRKNLDRVDDFFFALNKIEHKRSNLNNRDTHEKIKEILFPKSVSLGTILEEQVNILKKSLHVVPFIDEGHDLAVETYLSSIIVAQCKKYADVKLNVVPIGFSIVILDLLKNGVRHTKINNPELTIELYPCDENEIDDWLLKGKDEGLKVNDYMTLSVSNNEPIVFMDLNNPDLLYLDNYNHILGKPLKINENTSNTSRLGIRIIRTITNYDGLGASGKKWHYTPSKECLKCEYTKILLLIPKSDFTYGL